MKICKYCGKNFEKRANSEICFDCMPAGLTASERNSRKRELERLKNPIYLECPRCNAKFELPFGEVNRKFCFDCMPKGLSKAEQSSISKATGKKRALGFIGQTECQVCGYNRYQSALEFHHLNGDEKDFNLATKICSSEISEEIKDELKKCIVLCSNCHRALHAKEISL